MTCRGRFGYGRWMVGGLVLVGLMGLAVPWTVCSAEPAAKATAEKSAASRAADKFEASLKQAGFAYERGGGPGQPINFRVAVKDSSGNLYAQVYRVIEQNWKYADGTPAVLIHGVADVVAAANLPPGAGQKIAEYADKCTATGVCLNKSGACAFTGFLYDGAVNLETMNSYVFFLQDTVVGLRSALQGAAKN